VNWGSVDAFFAMGGYALHVWGSYVVTFALLAIEVIVLRAKRRSVLRQLRQGARERELLP